MSVNLTSRFQLLSINDQLTPVSSAGRRAIGRDVKLSATCNIAFREEDVGSGDAAVPIGAVLHVCI